MRVHANIKEIRIITERDREIKLTWDELRDVEKAIKFIRKNQEPAEFEYLEASL